MICVESPRCISTAGRFLAFPRSSVGLSTSEWVGMCEKVMRKEFLRRGPQLWLHMGIYSLK